METKDTWVSEHDVPVSLATSTLWHASNIFFPAYAAAALERNLVQAQISRKTVVRAHIPPPLSRVRIRMCSGLESRPPSEAAEAAEAAIPNTSSSSFSQQSKQPRTDLFRRR